MPNYIEVQNAGERISSNYISINANGSFSFYSGCCRQYGIENFKKTTILYDPQLKLLAFKMGSEELGQGAFSINVNKTNQTAWVGGGNFFKKFPELDLADLRGKYVPKREVDPVFGSLIVIDLHDKIEIKRKKSNKALV